MLSMRQLHMQPQAISEPNLANNSQWPPSSISCIWVNVGLCQCLYVPVYWMRAFCVHICVCICACITRGNSDHQPCLKPHFLMSYDKTDVWGVGDKRYENDLSHCVPSHISITRLMSFTTLCVRMCVWARMCIWLQNSITAMWRLTHFINSANNAIFWYHCTICSL